MTDALVESAVVCAALAAITAVCAVYLAVAGSSARPQSTAGVGRAGRSTRRFPPAVDGPSSVGRTDLSRSGRHSPTPAHDQCPTPQRRRTQGRAPTKKEA